IRDSKDLLKFSNSNSSGSGDDGFDPTKGMIGLKKRSLPTYQDGVQYAPGQYCKNDHYLLDRACAILGTVAAGMWLIDFCLIFGFCGSGGQYGPYRRDEDLGSRVVGGSNNPSSSMACHHQYQYQRRSQVGAGDYIAEDYYPAGGQPPPSSRHPGNHNYDSDTIYNEQDHYYYDMLEQRKRELEWRDQNRTLNDPKGHVQGPIPLSMQQSYYPTAYPDNVIVVRKASTTAERVMSPPVRMVIRDDFVAVSGSDDGVVGEGVMTVLSPPPRPNSTAVVNRFVQPPDSPTLPGQGYKQEDQGQPQPLQLTPSMNHTTSFSSATTTTTTSTTSQQPTPTPVSPLLAPKTPRKKTPCQTPTSSNRLRHKNSLPTLELPPHQLLCVTTPEDSTSATSPRYVVYPPGPACYVFDTSQQEYLPSFVNMAARIEQRQHLKHSHSLSSSSHGRVGTGTDPSTPILPSTSATGTGPPRSEYRVMVTGLGMEAITRSSAEIEAERAAAAGDTTTGVQSPNTTAAATLGSTESLATLDLTSSSGSGAPTSPGLATSSTTASKPQRIALPSGSSSGSYFPPPAVGSPTESLKSFTRRKSSDSHHRNQYRPHQYLQCMHSHPHPHSPLGTEISNDENYENEEASQLPLPPQQQQQQQLSKKPSMLKSKSSTQSIVTPNPQSLSLHNNQPSSTGSDLQSPQHLSTPSPPRSPYVGDF
ncbi:hypothetical protein BG015_000378, partial [Linnemannia schmuckeri]